MRETGREGERFCDGEGERLRSREGKDWDERIKRTREFKTQMEWVR